MRRPSPTLSPERDELREVAHRATASFVPATHERAGTSASASSWPRQRLAGKQPPVVENELLLQQPRNERRT
jgi:hypothetical protein